MDPSPVASINSVTILFLYNPKFFHIIFQQISDTVSHPQIFWYVLLRKNLDVLISHHAKYKYMKSVVLKTTLRQSSLWTLFYEIPSEAGWTI